VARDFERASSEYIQTSIGALDHTGSGGLTMAVIVRVESIQAGTASQSLITLSNSTPAFRQRFYLLSDGGGNQQLAYNINGGVAVVGTLDVQTDTWYLLAVTKAGGTTTPREHTLDMAAGTWTHTDMSSTLGNSGTPGGTGIVQIGRNNATNHFDGRMALAGAWKRELSDAQVETLGAGLRAWLAQKPDGLWPLNQGAVGTTVVDWTGGGANQTAISGTTISADHPLRWRWGGTVRRVQRVQGAATIVASGFDASGSFGSATVFRDQFLVASGFDASGSFGTPGVAWDQAIAATGYDASGGLGTPTVTPDNSIVATGFDASGSIGDATVLPGNVDIAATGFDASGSFGSATVTASNTVVASGFDASGSAGAPTVTADNAIAASGFDASGSFGSATVLPGNVDIAATGFDASGGFGDAAVLPGNADIGASGFDASGDFGYATVTGGETVVPAGIGPSRLTIGA